MAVVNSGVEVPDEQTHLLEGVLSCLICRYAFTPDPHSDHVAMISPCCHRLCLMCADRLETKMTDTKTGQVLFKGFPCPVCRRGVQKSSLKPCSFVADVAKKRHESVIPKTCKICTRKRAVQFRCPHCGQRMCKVCVPRHEHRPCEKIAASTRWDTYYCRDHMREILFYCNTCKVEFCTIKNNPEHKTHNFERVEDEKFLQTTNDKVQIYKTVLKGAEKLLATDIQHLQSHSKEERELITRGIMKQVREATLDSSSDDTPPNFRKVFFRHVVDEVGSLAVRMLQTKQLEVKYVLNCLEICKDFATGVVLRRLLDEILEPEIERLDEDIDISDPDKIQERLKGENVIQHIISGITPAVIEDEFAHYCLDQNIETSRQPQEGLERYFHRFGWDGQDEYILTDHRNTPPPSYLPKPPETIGEKFTEFLGNRRKEEVISCCLGFYEKEEDDKQKLIIDVLPNSEGSSNIDDVKTKLVQEFCEHYQITPDSIVLIQQESSFENVPRQRSSSREEVFASVTMFNNSGYYIVAFALVISDAVSQDFNVSVKDGLRSAETVRFCGHHGFLQSKKYVEDISNNELCIFPGHAISIGVAGPFKHVERSPEAEKAMVETHVASLVGISVFKAGNPDEFGEIKSVDKYIPICLSGYLCTGAVEIHLQEGDVDRNSLKEGDVLYHRNADDHCMLIGTVCKIQKGYVTEVNGAPGPKVERVLCALMSHNLQAIDVHHGLQFEHFIVDTPKLFTISKSAENADTSCSTDYSTSSNRRLMSVGRVSSMSSGGDDDADEDAETKAEDDDADEEDDDEDEGAEMKAEDDDADEDAEAKAEDDDADEEDDDEDEETKAEDDDADEDAEAKAEDDGEDKDAEAKAEDDGEDTGMMPRANEESEHLAAAHTEASTNEE